MPIEEEEEVVVVVVVVVAAASLLSSSQSSTTNPSKMTIYMHGVLNFRRSVRIQNGICGVPSIRLSVRPSVPVGTF
jgi:hypothetical protein